jgi:hypothetical protein
MIVIAISALIVAASILIHYETLRMATRRTAGSAIRPRVRHWLMLVGAIVSHLVHIGLFGLGFVLIEFEFERGMLNGPHSGTWEDAFYFAITSYTTLGIGDLYPTGQARLLSGIAALTGLIMVTWTASLTYLHMERYWTVGNGSDIAD